MPMLSGTQRACILGALLIVPSAGCGVVSVTMGMGPVMASAVRSRAASDFDCAESQVSVAEAGTDTSFRATGCGRTATYTCVAQENTDPACTREGNVR